VVYELKIPRLRLQSRDVIPGLRVAQGQAKARSSFRRGHGIAAEDRQIDPKHPIRVRVSGCHPELGNRTIHDPEKPVSPKRRVGDDQLRIPSFDQTLRNDLPDKRHTFGASALKFPFYLGNVA